MKSSPAIILRARTSLIESQRYHKCFGVYWATDAIPPAQNSRVSTVRPAPFLESVLGTSLSWFLFPLIDITASLDPPLHVSPQRAIRLPSHQLRAMGEVQAVASWLLITYGSTIIAWIRDNSSLQPVNPLPLPEKRREKSNGSHSAHCAEAPSLALCWLPRSVNGGLR